MLYQKHTEIFHNGKTGFKEGTKRLQHTQINKCNQHIKNVSTETT